MLESVRELLIRRVGSALTVTDIVDLANFIGRCVSGGGVRRCAEIALGPPDSEFVYLKDPERNPQRMAWGWASNNSVCATVGMDYTAVCARMMVNGEPGIVWLDNMQFGVRHSSQREKREGRASQAAALGLNGSDTPFVLPCFLAMPCLRLLSGSTARPFERTRASPAAIRAWR
jgi:hypothetical protein